MFNDDDNNNRSLQPRVVQQPESNESTGIHGTTY
jgi:hypothetical protein